MNRFFPCLVVVALLAFPSVTLAQTGSNASMTGTVRDASGAIVPGAQVSVSNADTGVVRSTTTNDVGLYYVPNLIPGPYELRVQASGFETTTIADIHLEIEQQARVDVGLAVGKVGQEVTVTSALPLLQTEDASVGTVVETNQVVSLPLNGRQFTQLLQLSPGTMPATYNYLFKSSDPMLAGQERNGLLAYDVNGGSAAFVTYRLDGVDNSEVEFGGANIPVSIDAISEVKIQTANFSPEYGRGPSQVDVTIKSGSNKLHGSAFEFVRNNYFDASEWAFSGPHVTPLLKRNQFGGTVGGPIKKDKLFFFFDYEGTREVLSAPQTTTVPSNDMRNGIFPSGVLVFDPLTGQQFPNNMIPSARFNTITQKILANFPLPNTAGVQNTNNAGLLLDPTQNYFFNPKRSRTINQENIRVDYNLSAKDTFFARYTQGSNYLLGQGPEATNLQGLDGVEQDNLGGRNISTTWEHNFGHATINELRFGVSTNPQNYQSVGPDGTTPFLQQWGLAQFMSPSAPPGEPLVSIGSTTISGGNTRPYRASETNWQGLDNLTLVRGKHTLRLGGEIFYEQKTVEDTARARGRFRFNGAQTRNPLYPKVATTNCPGSTVATSCSAGDATADFLLGDLSFFEAGQATTTIGSHFTSPAFYVWDTWHMTRKLTLNVGLRYEFTTRLTSDPPEFSLPIIQNGEFTGKVAVPNVSVASSQALSLFPGTVVTCRSIGLPDGCSITPKGEIQPRLGFAWQMNDKTVLRGGGGIFYGHALGTYQENAFDGNFPYQLDLTTTTYSRQMTPPPLSISNPVAGLNTPAPSIATFWSYYKDPSTYQWNLALERQLTKDTELTVAYVSALGRHLEGEAAAAANSCCFYNIPEPLGVVLAPGQNQTIAYPQFGPVSFGSYQDTSDYQALQVKLIRRLSKGLTLTAWYAHARNIGVTYGLTDPRYPDKSALYNDLPNTATISPIYQLPLGKGQAFLNHGGLLDQVVGGWQLGGIFTARSGFPFTPTLSGTNLLNNAELNEDVPNRICNGTISNPTPANWFDKSCFTMPVEPTTPGAQLVEGNSSVNILRGPRAFTFDANLSKTFSLTERYKLDFRFEIFNLLNHPNLGQPDASILPNGNNIPATITTTVTLPRILQFAMKFHF